MKTKSIAIKKRQRKEKRGFAKTDLNKRPGWRYIEVEINREVVIDGSIEGDEIEVIELHNLGICPVESRVDNHCINTWINQIAPVYISPAEFLAEMYVTSINDYALKIGANVGRIKHVRWIGDNHLRKNSVGHIFEPCPSGLKNLKQVRDVIKKYVNVVEIVTGDDVKLWRRSLLYDADGNLKQ